MKNRLKYWLPRLTILSFIFSMPFSTPEFIISMDESEFIVWLLRLIWVLAFPIAFCLLLILTLAVKNLKQRRKWSRGCDKNS